MTLGHAGWVGDLQRYAATVTSLQLVGGGRMGEALLGGLLDTDFASAADTTIVEPSPARRSILAELFPGVEVLATPLTCESAIIAVKPTVVPEACAALAEVGVGRVLSIAAGVTTETLESLLGGGVRVVRSMPNTPALIGHGAAAIAPGASATANDLDWAEAALSSVGTVVRVGESELDAVTGLSGSGPAYVFLVAEAMVDAGVGVGLDHQTAERLAYQTILGAAHMIHEADDDPVGLREAVTSPGGTTAAAIAHMEEDLRAAFHGAVVAATERSRELGA